MKKSSPASLALGFALGLSLACSAAARAPHGPTSKPGPMLSALVDPDPSHDPDNVMFLDLSNGQRVTIRLMPKWAPAHVERIKTLVRQGFYDGLIFHRVIDGFMAQTGDPTGTGQGGSKLPDLKAEFNTVPHVRGSVSMARTDAPDTANSQFFIVFYPHFALDKKYTNFGRVIAGMDAVDAVVRGEPPEHPSKILQASMEPDHKPPPAAVASLPGAVPTALPASGPTTVPTPGSPTP